MPTILQTSTTEENMIEIISFSWKRGQNEGIKIEKGHVYYFFVDASVMVMDVHLQTINSNASGYLLEYKGLNALMLSA